MILSPAAGRTLLISLLLTLATLTVYWPVQHFDFVHLDDNLYVTENVHVQQGLTRDGIGWAFSSRLGHLWMPLVWLSYMADIEWHGLHAGGFHLTNLLLHLANVVLLFQLLQRLTGATWRSAWVTALFALHPLHVESVAWVTERKDVLSTLFGLLTIGAYLNYIRQSRWTWYLATVLCFALGLMAKPMVVTLPFVLLLLDYWPLQRSATLSWMRLAREKLPLFALAAIGSVLAFVFVQPARVSLDTLSPATRLATALIAYTSYLGKMVWPTGLACYYPHPGSWPVEQVIGAGAVLGALTAFVVWRGRREPAWVVGWCWYLGTLVPVIGLSQAGLQAMADRFTYIPLIGIGIAAAWGMHAWLGRGRASRVALAGAGAALVAAWALVSARQVRVWRDSTTLFEHTLALTENNVLIHYSFGSALAKTGRLGQAIDQFERALRIKPRFADAHLGLGQALADTGQPARAIAHFQQALEFKPDQAAAHNQLGLALIDVGRTAEAIAHFEQALRIDPALAEVHNNLGMALARSGRLPEALRQFEEALRINPQNARAHYNLGLARSQTGSLTAAVAAFEQALRLQPDDAAAHNDLAIVLTRDGRLPEAIAHFEQALRLQPDNSDFHYNLGATLLQQGRAADAVPHLQQRLRTQPDHAAARVQLALAFQQAGRTAEAIALYEEMLQAQPSALGPLNNLAWLRATATDPALRDGPAAVRLAERAAELTGRRLPEYLDTLAAAYAEAGRWPEAVATGEQAQALARAASREPLAAEIGARLEQYRAGRAWRL